MRAGVIVSYSGVKLIYRYTHSEFNNIPTEFPQHVGKHELWASYKFNNGIEPYLFLVDGEYAKNVDVNLGLQYNF